MNLKFSFVIPVYNAKQYLDKCVQSILHQTYKNLEVILVDDCSNDWSGDLCDKLANSDFRVRVIHKNNEGPGIARNVGIDNATGDFIIFCDADDYYSSKEFLETVFLRMKADTDIVVFDYMSLYSSELYKKRKCISELSNNYSTGNDYLQAALHLRYDYRWFPVLYTFRKSLFEEKIKFPNERLGEDTATIYKLLLEAGNVEVIQTPFYVYRRNSGNNLSSIQTYSTLSGIIEVAERCIKDISSRGSIEANLKVALANNFATAYFTALIQADKLSNKEFERLVELLRAKRYLADYAVSKKQVFTRNLIKIIGIKKTAWLLGIRRRLKELNK